MSALATLWRDHRIALVGFVLAALLVVFFLLRLSLATVYWANPAHRALPPEGWMTPGYVASSWRVPREAVAEALNLEFPGERGLTLSEIAARRKMPLTELIEALAPVLVRP
jgi:hypothetical protein